MLPYKSLVCFVVGLMMGSSFGFTVEITMTSSPPEIQMVKTKTLELKCDIVHVPDSTPRGDSVMKKVDHVAGISILDVNEETVAKVREDVDGGEPELEIRYKDFEEKGAYADYSVGNKTGYLHLYVPLPDQSNAFEYKCQGTVWNEEGVIPYLVALVNVPYKSAVIDNVALVVNDLVRIVKNLTDENQRLLLKVDQNTEIVKTRVAFSAVRETSSSSQYEYVKPGHTIQFNKIITNIGGGFDINNATFVCPVAGPYYITHDMGVFGGYWGGTSLSVNGEAITWSYYRDRAYWGKEGAGVVVELSKDDEVNVVAIDGVDPSRFWWWSTVDNKHVYTSTFSGYLLK